MNLISMMYIAMILLPPNGSLKNAGELNQNRKEDIQPVSLEVLL